MASIDIAKESSVEEINTNIGDNTDTSSDSGTTLFGKIKYCVDTVKAIVNKITPDRMSKIDSIGTAADSVTAESVFGKLNKAISAMDTESGEDTPQSTVIVSSAVSGSGALLGTFTAPVSRVYNVAATLKASATGAANAAQVICSRKVITAAADGVLVASRASTTAAEVTARIYLNAGQTYYFYLFGGGTPQISSLALAYGTLGEDLSMPSLTASTDYKAYLPKQTASGTGTTETTVAEWEVLFYGSVKIQVTRDSAKAAYTKWKLYKNNVLVSTNTASTQVVSLDVNINKGDILKLTAYGGGADQEWEIEYAHMCYTLSWMGTNPLIIQC